LTIKLTRCTADYWELTTADWVISRQFSVLSKTTTHRENFIAPPCSSHA